MKEQKDFYAEYDCGGILPVNVWKKIEELYEEKIYGKKNYMIGGIK